MPTITHYRGKPIEELSREELIGALENEHYLTERQRFDHARELNMLSHTRRTRSWLERLIMGI